MASTEGESKFTLTAEALAEALPQMDIATKVIHADDFVSSHRAIAPGLHVAVNYRYARDPESLVQLENNDVRAVQSDANASAVANYLIQSPMHHTIRMYIHGIRRRTRVDSRPSYRACLAEES